MHHIMREDARRRFTFGFTIENRTMRLWYADRSEILISDFFDFISVRHYPPMGEPSSSTESSFTITPLAASLPMPTRPTIDQQRLH